MKIVATTCSRRHLQNDLFFSVSLFCRLCHVISMACGNSSPCSPLCYSGTYHYGLAMDVAAWYLFYLLVENQQVFFLVIWLFVPMFFYLVHLFIIHLAAMLAAVLTGWNWSTMVLEAWITDLSRMKGYGFSLPIVYLIWVTMIVFILFPLCRAYHGYKMSNKDKNST